MIYEKKKKNKKDGIIEIQDSVSFLQILLIWQFFCQRNLLARKLKFRAQVHSLLIKTFVSNSSTLAYDCLRTSLKTIRFFFQ